MFFEESHLWIIFFISNEKTQIHKEVHFISQMRISYEHILFFNNVIFSADQRQRYCFYIDFLAPITVFPNILAQFLTDSRNNVRAKIKNYNLCTHDPFVIAVISLSVGIYFPHRDLTCVEWMTLTIFQKNNLLNEIISRWFFTQLN